MTLKILGASYALDVSSSEQFWSASIVCASLQVKLRGTHGCISRTVEISSYSLTLSFLRMNYG